jgi:20S proteasome alpha/beta subunit
MTNLTDTDETQGGVPTTQTTHMLREVMDRLIDRVTDLEDAVDNAHQAHRSLRYRVNVSTSVKGVKTWDVTCDGDEYTMEEILERSDAIVAELDKRYPPPDPQ